MQSHPFFSSQQEDPEERPSFADILEELEQRLLKRISSSVYVSGMDQTVKGIKDTEVLRKSLMSTTIPVPARSSHTDGGKVTNRRMAQSARVVSAKVEPSDL